MVLKKDFVWGVATAAYQIEGAAYEMDKGLNVWDVASHTPGRIFEGHTGDVACDHYHRYKEDVELMKKLGVNAYRFSVNWARVIPNGTGNISQCGLHFYDELVDELLRNGITPYMTLFHWDYPYELQKRGGWLNPESPNWFLEYTKVLAEHFKDRVKHFFTINEPQNFIGQGYQSAMHPPFISNTQEMLLASHHALIANGLACRELRSTIPDCKIGMAPVGNVKMPLTDADTELAYNEMFRFNGHTFNNSWFSDPVILGEYPEDCVRGFGFKYADKDLDIIRCDMDFYGVNIYTGRYVTQGENGEAIYPLPAPNTPKTQMNWNIYPQSMYWGLKFLYRRYGLPLIIAENGIALPDWRMESGEVLDYGRVDFMTKYLRELKRAVADGVLVDGYFHWSLMDNFEWTEGFSKRFGLVYVNYDTQERTIKKSGKFYSKIIECNAENIGMERL